MKRILPLAMLLGVLLLCAQASAVNIEPVRAGEPGGRPYSWYYPYEYQYYTPHNAPYGSDGCYWIYTDGTYVYTCS